MGSTVPFVALSALGEPFRADDRCRPTKASPEASQTGLKIDGRMVYLLAGRRRRRRSPRCAGPVQAKQARRAETDAQAPEEVCLRPRAVGHRRFAILQRHGSRAWDRERHERGRWKNNRAENSHQPTRRRERKMQRFKSPGVSPEISFRTRRRLEHLQCSTPSRLSSNASHVSR